MPRGRPFCQQLILFVLSFVFSLDSLKAFRGQHFWLGVGIGVDPFGPVSTILCEPSMPRSFFQRDPLFVDPWFLGDQFLQLFPIETWWNRLPCVQIQSSSFLNLNIFWFSNLTSFLVRSLWQKHLLVLQLEELISWLLQSIFFCSKFLHHTLNYSKYMKSLVINSIVL